MTLQSNEASREAHKLIVRELGDWLNKDRRWCAYCGMEMAKRRNGKGQPARPKMATRDHVIPRKHGGGRLTIPACYACNTAKRSMSLPEFLMSEHFIVVRQHRHKNQWPLEKLWLALALSAIRRSMAP